jgi:hypothetical protein
MEEAPDIRCCDSLSKSDGKLDWSGLIEEFDSDSGGLLLLLFPFVLPTAEWTKIAVAARTRVDMQGNSVATIISLRTTSALASDLGLANGVRSCRVQDLREISVHFAAALSGSVILIDALEHFIDTTQAMAGVPTRIWSGATLHLRTEAEIYGPGLAAAARTLIDLAEVQHVLVVAAARVSGQAYDFFDEGLRGRRNLRVLRGATELDNTSEKLARIINQVSGGALSLRQAVDLIRGEQLSSAQQSLCLSYLYTAVGWHVKAWETVEPVLDSFLPGDAKFALSMAQAALAAFRLGQAQTLLNKALTFGLGSASEIQAARMLANGLGDENLISQLTTDLFTRFPNSSIALRENLSRVSDNRCYAEAAEIAGKLALSFEEVAFRALADGCDLATLPTLFNDQKDISRAHLLAAREAEKRGDLDDAVRFSAAVDPGDLCFDDALAVRLSVLRSGILYHGEIKKEDADEFVNILKLSSTQLRLLSKARRMLLQILGEDLTDELALTLLLTSVFKLLPDFVSRAKAAPRAVTVSEDGESVSIEELHNVLTTWLQNLRSSVLILGQDNLPCDLHGIAGAKPCTWPHGVYSTGPVGIGSNNLRDSCVCCRTALPRFGRTFQGLLYNPIKYFPL